MTTLANKVDIRLGIFYGPKEDKFFWRLIWQFYISFCLCARACVCVYVCVCVCVCVCSRGLPYFWSLLTSDLREGEVTDLRRDANARGVAVVDWSLLSVFGIQTSTALLDMEVTLCKPTCLLDRKCFHIATDEGGFAIIRKYKPMKRWKLKSSGVWRRVECHMLVKAARSRGSN